MPAISIQIQKDYGTASGSLRHTESIKEVGASTIEHSKPNAPNPYLDAQNVSSNSDQFIHQTEIVAKVVLGLGRIRYISGVSNGSLNNSTWSEICLCWPLTYAADESSQIRNYLQPWQHSCRFVGWGCSLGSRKSWRCPCQTWQLVHRIFQEEIKEFSKGKAEKEKMATDL